MPNIPVFKPLIEKEELEITKESLELGWLGMGSYVGIFEEKIKEYITASDRYVAAVSTGHAALHLALLLRGIGPGDEVITPSFNNIADFQAILAVGAEPVFCDIDDKTLCIDLDKAETLISPKTKAIIVMDYACMLCDHNAVKGFTDEHSLIVIHDAAHSIGSKYQGKMIGSFSDICMFSFDPIKTITCIDGGALIVKTQNELKNIQEMRLIGMGQPPEVMYQNQRAWTYDVRQMGFRYHMANLHAAVGLSQIQKLGKISESRLVSCRYYNENLQHLPQIKVPQTDFKGITPFLYYIRILDGHRDHLRAFLQERGIDTGIHWQPGHWFTLFKNFRRGDLSVTEQVGKEILTLPLHSMMPIEITGRVINTIREYYAK